jgi:hypothetical protein
MRRDYPNAQHAADVDAVPASNVPRLCAPFGGGEFWRIAVYGFQTWMYVSSRERVLRSRRSFRNVNGLLCFKLLLNLRILAHRPAAKLLNSKTR